MLIKSTKNVLLDILEHQIKHIESLKIILTTNKYNALHQTLLAYHYLILQEDTF